MRKSAKEYSRIYHKELYERDKLFEPGSWMEKPDSYLLNLVKRYFENRSGVKVLDLGSGVGRNAIPIAKIVGPSGGSVVCVDFLEIAIKKLQEIAKKHRVDKYIEAHVLDVENFQIDEEAYNLIVAISVLEHGSTDEKHFHESLKRIMSGTKKSGINYLAISTDLKETDEQSGEILPITIAIDLTYEEAEKLLKNYYKDWNMLDIRREPYEERFIKEGRKIIWRTDYLYFVVQKPA